MDYKQRAESKKASDWLNENDPKRGRRRKGPNSKAANSREPRDVRIKTFRPESIKEFTRRHMGHKGCECVFVPGAVKGIASQVDFFGRGMAASHWMCLLTHGTARSQGMLARHICGNGHLSCINPNHIIWGMPGDNTADANKHRAAGKNTQDRIHSIS